MPSRLPPRLQPWHPACVESGERRGVNACLILGVLDRESLGGEALKPRGPAGTGDATPRRWARYAHRADTERFRRWTPPREEWEHLFKGQSWSKLWPQDVCLPADGLGWGRGLMQPDYAAPDNESFFAELMPDGTPAWKDGPRNIDIGTQKLAQLIQLFQFEEGLAAAAYNAGRERVLEAIAALSAPTTPEGRLRAADSVTTGKNYASDVLLRRDRFFALLAHEIPAA